ncbi:MAG: S-adenosylmethionine:tRNA ribosyltransferase-isomerase [Candidatus Falkowbacteria bacterium]|nr:S-adenosylmethionine:tRNA ribosyltransferase-isomerase [Candidatus Falkowbacteria bacterium]
MNAREVTIQSMQLSEFDYNLPKELIAQKLVEPRDQSRLLILNKSNGSIEHKHFFDIIDYLKKGDILIMNNSKVMKARLIGHKQKTKGKVEIFLLKVIDQERNIWQCLVGGLGGMSAINKTIEFSRNLSCKILQNNNDGTWTAGFNLSLNEMIKIVEEIGEVPLPPYIKREKENQLDQKNYQTVYADDKKIGSVAAPTVTLHVGMGTFSSVKVDDITKHKMHSEFVEVAPKVIQKILKAKKQNKKIITVGTTSASAVESIFTNYDPKYEKNGFTGWVDIFIYPGYQFKIVSSMITNFHLPKSTLLMLISTLAGQDLVRQAYQEAIEKKYRFFSYGDAMFID